MIYFRKYIEAYDSATAELSMEEDGAYDRLLRHYYKTELPIPFGREAQIARAVKATERKAVHFVLTTFFEKRADGWHNKRADREIAVSQQARKNGANGGRPPNDKTGSITGIEESGSQSGYVKPPEKQTGSGQPNKPTSTKSPSLTNRSLSNPPNQNRCEGASPAPPSSEAWEAYSTAYRQRYGAEPVRNARVNGQLANLVARLGASEAPQVAAYYLTHNRAAYVRSNHAVGLLLADAEGLRTEWATSRKVSETEAIQADRTMATGNAFAPLIEQAKREAIA